MLILIHVTSIPQILYHFDYNFGETHERESLMKIDGLFNAPSNTDIKQGTYRVCARSGGHVGGVKQ